MSARSFILFLIFFSLQRVSVLRELTVRVHLVCIVFQSKRTNISTGLFVITVDLRRYVYRLSPERQPIAVLGSNLKLLLRFGL